MKTALLLLVALAVAGCGARKAETTGGARGFAPSYPGSTNREVTNNGAFTTVDFRLPPDASAAKVYDWYVSYLRAHGWKVTDRNQTGLRAEKAGHTIDVGVRGRTLEENLG